MLLNLIAIDPGGETGIAWAAYNSYDKQSVHRAVWSAFRLGLGEAWQVSGEPKDQVLELYETILDRMKRAGHGQQDTYKVRTIVVCEDFVPPASRARKKSILLPVKIAAMLEYQVWLEKLEVEWVWQQPSERNVVTDDMLRKWHLWQPGKKNDDAMAALKHLLVRARKEEK